MIMQGVPQLQVHFIDCGQGNMVLAIMPDSTVLLFDCRVTQDDEDRILDYLGTYIPERNDPGSDEPGMWIDWFVSSHRDEDHLLGLKAVNAQFPIRGIVDSGTTSGSTSGAQNKYYMGLRRSLRDVYGDDAVIEPTPSHSPLFTFGDAFVYCLCSGVGEKPSDDGHYGNLVSQIEFAGNRILLPGDSDWRSWKEKIVPAFASSGLLKSTLFLAIHHGSRSFFVEIDPNGDDENWEDAYLEHLPLIAPSMTILSCGDQEQYNHPNPEARKKYVEYTSNKQVYLTREKGTLVGCFYSNGNWTVIPSRFLAGWNYRRNVPAGKRFWIKCEEHDPDDNLLSEIKSGAQVPRRNKLKFTALSSGGLQGNSPRWYFEVSNGGIGVDANSDEIYWKKKSEGLGNTFKRHVAYEGVHLLRCQFWDKSTRQRAQEIFIVQGIK